MKLFFFINLRIFNKEKKSLRLSGLWLNYIKDQCAVNRHVYLCEQQEACLIELNGKCAAVSGSGLRFLLVFFLSVEVVGL